MQNNDDCVSDYVTKAPHGIHDQSSICVTSFSHIHMTQLRGEGLCVGFLFW